MTSGYIEERGFPHEQALPASCFPAGSSAGGSDRPGGRRRFRRAAPRRRTAGRGPSRRIVCRSPAAPRTGVEGTDKTGRRTARGGLRHCPRPAHAAYYDHRFYGSAAAPPGPHAGTAGRVSRGHCAPGAGSLAADRRAVRHRQNGRPACAPPGAVAARGVSPGLGVGACRASPRRQGDAHHRCGPGALCAA